MLLEWAIALVPKRAVVASLELPAMVASIGELPGPERPQDISPHHKPSSSNHVRKEVDL